MIKNTMILLLMLAVAGLSWMVLAKGPVREKVVQVFNEKAADLMKRATDGYDQSLKKIHEDQAREPYAGKDTVALTKSIPEKAVVLKTNETGANGNTVDVKADVKPEENITPKQSPMDVLAGIAQENEHSGISTSNKAPAVSPAPAKNENARTNMGHDHKQASRKKSEDLTPHQLKTIMAILQSARKTLNRTDFHVKDDTPKAPVRKPLPKAQPIVKKKSFTGLEELG